MFSEMALEGAKSHNTAVVVFKLFSEMALHDVSKVSQVLSVAAVRTMVIEKI